MLNCTRLRKLGLRCDRYIKRGWKVGMPPKVWWRKWLPIPTIIITLSFCTILWRGCMATVYPVGVVSRHLLLVLLGADVHHGCCRWGERSRGAINGELFLAHHSVEPNFVTPCPTFSRPHYVKLKFSWLNWMRLNAEHSAYYFSYTVMVWVWVVQDAQHGFVEIIPLEVHKNNGAI